MHVQPIVNCHRHRLGSPVCPPHTIFHCCYPNECAMSVVHCNSGSRRWTMRSAVTRGHVVEQLQKTDHVQFEWTINVRNERRLKPQHWSGQTRQSIESIRCRIPFDYTVCRRYTRAGLITVHNLYSVSTCHECLALHWIAVSSSIKMDTELCNL